MTDRSSWVWPFDRGSRQDRALLGGKGANLCEMRKIGLPVPDGFIITTDACRAYLADGRLPHGLRESVAQQLRALEQRTGRQFGHGQNPLLLSVRSGAVFSMPGMMDTVLNLGATTETITQLSRYGGQRFAVDVRRRFLEMYGRVVLGIDGRQFSAHLESTIDRAGVATERELSDVDLRAITAAYEGLLRQQGHETTEDPFDQLIRAIEAVFSSWNGDRAKSYRRMEGIPDDLGTAVNVQMMVYGNVDDTSATGVAFTRDPATGEARAYGDFLINAQGEDVVSGTREVLPLDALAGSFPRLHRELLGHLRTLEQHERDMCDVEFTIERGKLWMLQTRVGKRSATAAVRMACEMVDEGLINERHAVRRVKPEQVERLLHPHFPTPSPEPLTIGLGASPGAAVGKVAFSADDAVARAHRGEAVILVRPETSPDDLDGMLAAHGLLTSRGGLVSHAAVVARGIGKPAVCGASELVINLENHTAAIGSVTIDESTVISIDGSAGHVVIGSVALELPQVDERLGRLLDWADQARSLHVYANADSAADAQRALDAGAEGIGLCRTEHQFLGDRLPLIQRIILAADETETAEALAELGQLQQSDFTALLEVMDGKTVVIRLLDPPLHEFLPDVTELRAAGKLNDHDRKLLEAAERLYEHNPMLGVRGIRLGVLRPELYRTQIRAILRAAADRSACGGDPRPEIMFPLVSTKAELAWGISLITEIVAELAAENVRVAYTTATMIETPRAAIIAAELAPLVDAFSFGTNDLTQLTFGLSRDDVEATYTPAAQRLGLLPVDPFRSLDPDGVGWLLDHAVTAGRQHHPNLVTGICGEHGGDPDSIRLAHAYGLDHVSCSPGRIAVARLAAAHAALDMSGPDTAA